MKWGSSQIVSPLVDLFKQVPSVMSLWRPNTFVCRGQICGAMLVFTLPHWRDATISESESVWKHLGNKSIYSSEYYCTAFSSFTFLQLKIFTLMIQYMCCVCALHLPCLIDPGWHGDAESKNFFASLLGEKKKEAFSAWSDLYCRPNDQGPAIKFHAAFTWSRSFSYRDESTTSLALGAFINLRGTVKARHSPAQHRTAPPPSGRTRFEILISSTLTKLMCRDGCNYKHNMECNHPIMIGDTWESAGNHICSGSDPPPPLPTPPPMFETLFGRLIPAKVFAPCCHSSN